MRPAYCTPRLVVRAWTPADAPARKAAVDVNLDHLRPWFPWAAADPRPVEEHAALLATQAADFAAGRWWSYGVWRPEPTGEVDGAGGAALVGAVGVYRARQDVARPSVREISYWLTAAATGRGYATEAVGAIAEAALAEPGVLGLEIRVDPANAPSARVPPRLGFALRERLAGDRTGLSGEPLDTLVWERRHYPVRLRPATPADVPRLQAIRVAARGNRPACAGVATAAHDREAVAAGLCWVWADAAGVQGFACGHPGGIGEIWALAVDPRIEGRGADDALVAQLTDVLWARGHRRLMLRVPAGSPAEALYQFAGWTGAVHAANGDVIFRRDL